MLFSSIRDCKLSKFSSLFALSSLNFSSSSRLFSIDESTTLCLDLISWEEVSAWEHLTRQSESFKVREVIFWLSSTVSFENSSLDERRLFISSVTLLSSAFFSSISLTLFEINCSFSSIWASIERLVLSTSPISFLSLSIVSLLWFKVVSKTEASPSLRSACSS